MLIQPADYNEVFSCEPKTAAKLEIIKQVFPNLKLSDIKGKTIVSPVWHSTKDIPTSEAMGKILDYPCADEYTYILNNPDGARVAISVNVLLRTGGKVQIFVFVCRSEEHYSKTVHLG